MNIIDILVPVKSHYTVRESHSMASFIENTPYMLVIVDRPGCYSLEKGCW